MTDIDRFMKRVKKGSSCWIWCGSLFATNNGSRLGYGQFINKLTSNFAHRFSYRYVVGHIPRGFVIDHICNNTVCVNPDHLRILTIQENLARGNGAPAKNARKTVCTKGHPLVAGNLVINQFRRKRRICLICTRSYDNAWKKKNREAKRRLPSHSL